MEETRVTHEQARLLLAAQRIAEYKASEADWREKLRDTQAKLEEAEREVAELRASRDHYRDRKRELEQQEVSLRDDISELSRKLEAAERDRDDNRTAADYERNRCDQLLDERNRARNETIAALEKLEAITEDRRVQRVRAADAEIALTEERSLTAELRVKLEAAEQSAKNWKRNWEIASDSELRLEAQLKKLNHAAADLVAEAVGPYDPTQAGSNLEKLYRLVTRPSSPNQPPPAKPLTPDDGAGQVSHLVSEYLKIQLATCEAIPNGHPMKGQLKSAFAITEQLLGGIASKLEAALTPDDVRTIAREVIAEVAERADASTDDGFLFERLAMAAKE